MTKVKICGITNIEDAELCVRMGADALGFNFYSESKRYISPDHARNIIERSNGNVPNFGVFVNESIDKILEATMTSLIDVIQLHGDESPEFVESLRKGTDALIIKAIRVSSDFAPSVIEPYAVNGVLLDSFSEKERGGSGMTFDWSKAAEVSAAGVTLYLAGGLTPENVAEAIRAVRPYAVDVASGVESAPRKKDPAKLEEFIKNAKQA